MAKLMNYRVLRRHDGDRLYEEGDTRTARDVDVKHLIPNVLEEIGPAEFGGKGDHDGNGETGGAAVIETRSFSDKEIAKEPAEKAESAPLNKAESAAPANKAASPRKSKGK